MSLLAARKLVVREIADICRPTGCTKSVKFLVRRTTLDSVVANWALDELKRDWAFDQLLVITVELAGDAA